MADLSTTDKSCSHYYIMISHNLSYFCHTATSTTSNVTHERLDAIIHGTHTEVKTIWRAINVSALARSQSTIMFAGGKIQMVCLLLYREEIQLPVLMYKSQSRDGQ